MNALCFTVEIDKKQFPDATDLIDNLQDENIFYISSMPEHKFDLSDNICYQFDYDEHSIEVVSNILAEIIKLNYLNDYADTIIETNYIGIDKLSRKEIIHSVLKYADTNCITSLIKDFIVMNKHIHLGGFVLFRMKNFLDSFDDEIDFAIDEFIEQQRYRDFVKFLKFFVDIQETSFDKINLLIRRNGKHLLLDKNANPISSDLLDHTHCEISTLDNNESYLVINDLISLAPKHITIHCRTDLLNDELVKTIKEIFNDKVDFCHHCNICLH